MGGGTLRIEACFQYLYVGMCVLSMVYLRVSELCEIISIFPILAFTEILLVKFSIIVIIS